MLTREENDLITQSGRGTPLGELMRLYWIPAFYSHEIRETRRHAPETEAARRGPRRLPRHRGERRRHGGVLPASRRVTGTRSQRKTTA